MIFYKVNVYLLNKTLCWFIQHLYILYKLTLINILWANIEKYKRLWPVSSLNGNIRLKYSCLAARCPDDITLIFIRRIRLSTVVIPVTPHIFVYTYSLGQSNILNSEYCLKIHHKTEFLLASFAKRKNTNLKRTSIESSCRQVEGPSGIW